MVLQLPRHILWWCSFWALLSLFCVDQMPGRLPWFGTSGFSFSLEFGRVAGKSRNVNNKLEEIRDMQIRKISRGRV